LYRIKKLSMAEVKDPLLDVIASMDKRFGKGAVIVGDTVIQTERQKTGSLGMDIITGGGWGKGRMVEIFAPESSGKTTLCIHTMIQAQKDNPDQKVAFIDAEHAFDRNYAEHLGLDMSQVIISQPDSGEQALEIAEALIASGKISVCVIDSVAALTPRAEIEGEMGDSKMGLHARLMSQACRKLTGVVSKTNTVLLWTNQIRMKIGVMFGSPETVPGGEALKFYASIRVDMRKSKGDDDSDGNRINSKVKAKTIKNKLAAPFQVTEFDIVFGEGIDRASEILAIAENIGIIKKGGSWFSYGETKLGQGAANVKELLRDNPELSDEIEFKIRTHFNIL
jgi:recombination protein RecA